VNITAGCQRCGAVISIEVASKTCVTTCYYCHDEMQAWTDHRSRRLRDQWGKREMGRGKAAYNLPLANMPVTKRPEWHYNPKSIDNLMVGKQKRKP
jgi:hypothetical protein